METHHRKASLFNTIFNPLLNNAHVELDVDSVERTELLKLMSNDTRAKDLNSFRNNLLNGLVQSPISVKPEQDESLLSEASYEYIYELAEQVTNWILSRHDSLVNLLKPSKFRDNPIIEGFNLVQMVLEDSSDVLLKQLWWKYKNQVEESEMEMPLPTDPNYHLVEETKTRAVNYYTKCFNDLIKTSTRENLIAYGYYIVQLAAGSKLIALIFSQMLKVIPADRMENEVYPRLCLLCCVSKKAYTKETLEYLIKNGEAYLQSDLVNSILEYSSHSVSGSSIYSLILEPYGSKIKTEGMLAALMVAVSRGSKQLVSIFQFFLFERLELPSTMDGFMLFSLDDSWDDHNRFLPPYLYIFFIIAAQTPVARSSSIEDLIQMYERDPVKSLLIAGGIKGETHDQFIDGILNLACKLNHLTATKMLLESNWISSNLMNPIYNAVTTGNQKILRSLLESLLAPDAKITLPYGAVPVIFRKPGALKLLPIIASRFPGEAEWFLGELTGIPIPLAVHPDDSAAPIVGSEWLSELRFGHINITTALTEPEQGIPHVKLWEALGRVGELRKISSRESQPEEESVICMIPDIMTQESEICIDKKAGYFKRTNPLIRLLDIDNEAINLSPIVQTMVEFHWSNGKFWYRFGAQLLFGLIYIMSAAALFARYINERQGIAVIEDVLAVLMCVFFLGQEIRQFMDNHGRYMTSISNLIDVFIYVITLTITFSPTPLPALLKSLVIIFSTIRLLLHLRIFPSVGPIIRITSSALYNVTPIFIPMMCLFLAYSVGFFILHRDLIGPGTKFDTFWRSLQFTLTMITFDYSMIEEVNSPSMFVLRILFHFTFLICFINIIVALMTVNVADVTSNLQAAYLLEISQLMIELELYWPWPYFSKLKFRSTTAAGKMASLGSINHLNSSLELEKINVILYSLPISLVMEKTWWKDYPRYDLTKAPIDFGKFHSPQPSMDRMSATRVTRVISAQKQKTVVVSPTSSTHLGSDEFNAESSPAPPKPKTVKKRSNSILVKNQNKSFKVGSLMAREPSFVKPLLLTADEDIHQVKSNPSLNQDSPDGSHGNLSSLERTVKYELSRIREIVAKLEQRFSMLDGKNTNYELQSASSQLIAGGLLQVETPSQLDLQSNFRRRSQVEPPSIANQQQTIATRTIERLFTKKSLSKESRKTHPTE